MKLHHLALPAACVALAIVTGPAAAVPPLVIGDAPTADRGHLEWYTGVQWQRNDAGELSIPTSELVLGVSDWQEVSLEAPFLSIGGERGFGDLVLGTKARLAREGGSLPGLSASLEWKLPSASRAAGLGSGASELELRLRGQRTWAWFTLIGNAAYALVGEPRVAGRALPRRNTGFLGAGAEAEILEGVALVADGYWRSADVPGEPARAAGDVGVKLRLTHGLALDAAVGRSLRAGAAGGPELRVYGGLRGELGVF
ncbi:MAG: transporter [Anaeromyxobacter sp.]